MSPRLLSSEIHQRPFSFFQRRQDRALVRSQRSFGAGIGGFDARLHPAEIKRRPGDARTEIPFVSSAFAQAGKRVGLKAYASDERDSREQVARGDTDLRRGGSEGALGGANVRATTQECCRIAKRESRHR